MMRLNTPLARLINPYAPRPAPKVRLGPNWTRYVRGKTCRRMSSDCSREWPRYTPGL